MKATVPTPAQHKAPLQPRRPRGRPKTEDLGALEERLILVARELFFREGYGGTTMSDVAEVARVSKRTLYARFDSKAALLRGIVADQIQAWNTGRNHTPIEDHSTLRQTLLAYGDIVLRAGLSPDFVQLNRLLFGESGRFPELAEIANTRARLGVAYLAEQIREFADRESIPCRDPEAAAELFMMMLIGWSNTQILDNRIAPPSERHAWLHNCVRLFLGSRADW